MNGNNKAFLAQTVVMTANETLSIANALKGDRPDDYYENAATIEWPLGPHGEAFPIAGTSFQLSSSRMPVTSSRPRSSFASSWPRAG